MTSSVKINLCKSNRREKIIVELRVHQSIFLIISTCLSLATSNHNTCSRDFAAMNFLTRFSCMLTKIYGAFLHFLWILLHRYLTIWTYSPSDLLFLGVSKTSWLATVVSLCRRCFCCCCRFSLCLSRNLRQLFTLWANLATSGQTIFVVW